MTAAHTLPFATLRTRHRRAAPLTQEELVERAARLLTLEQATAEAPGES